MKLSGEAQAVLLKYALIAAAGYFVYKKLSSTASETIDLVKNSWNNLDLNPFDENGVLGLSLPAGTLIASGYDSSHDAALAKIGVDISKYRVWYPDPLNNIKMPAGTYQVKWGTNKITYYAPKTALDIFNL